MSVYIINNYNNEEESFNAMYGDSVGLGAQGPR